MSILKWLKSRPLTTTEKETLTSFFSKVKKIKPKELNIALVGQANVGKSVVFNNLTGLHQHIGNWPGKTVEKAEGKSLYRNYLFNIVDLPGIYSLTTYSIEEEVSRNFIGQNKFDFIVNVVDGTILERNLIFTLQLLEMEKPMVLAVNFVNFFQKKGIAVDFKKLEKILNIPVIPVEANIGKGTAQILARGLSLIKKKTRQKTRLRYGLEVEKEINRLVSELKTIKSCYPKRWLAIKLLEKDKEVEQIIITQNAGLLAKIKKSISRLEKIHGHDTAMIIAGERAQIAAKIVSEVLTIKRNVKVSLIDKIDRITSDRIWGYPILFIVLTTMFFSVFKFGDFLSNFLNNYLGQLQILYQSIFGNHLLASVGWSAIESFFGLVNLVFPYIIPFYFLLFFLEDIGYFARVSFLLDRVMHQLGIHGKGIIPILLGYGCHVPACLSCRIMENKKEKLISVILTTFVPCSAVSIIIFGLVGKYIGLTTVFLLYGFDILIILILGKILAKIIPGESPEMIMEIPDYRRPYLKVILMQTWFRIKEFLYIAAPLIIIMGMLIELSYKLGWLLILVNFLKPVTVGWLGLPKMVGSLLIFGFLRKELILVMMAGLFQTTNFAQILNHTQMIVLSLVSLFYVPCVATTAALIKEYSLKFSLTIIVVKLITALLIGGLAFRLLTIL